MTDTGHTETGVNAPVGTTTNSPSSGSTSIGADATGSSAQGDQRSLGEIVGDVAENLSALLRQEVELAKTELKQEATKAGKGAGLLGGAGIAGHLALVFLSLALVYLLDVWMPIPLGALIVAALWGLAAAVLGLKGKKELKQSNPQLPKTQQTLKEDAEWARAQKS